MRIDPIVRAVFRREDVATASEIATEIRIFQKIHWSQFSSDLVIFINILLGSRCLNQMKANTLIQGQTFVIMTTSPALARNQDVAHDAIDVRTASEKWPPLYRTLFIIASSATLWAILLLIPTVLFF